MIFSRDEKDNKLIKLLKQSQQDFVFDQNQSKIRLMQGLDKAQETRAIQPMHHWHIMRYASALACLVVLVSGTFAVASNAQPGDRLFPVNKFREQMILSLPLSAEQKAGVQEKIVAQRLQALDQVQTKTEQIKLETVKESDESLKQAIEAISVSKQSLRASGNVRSAAQMQKILNQLETLAQEHEDQIQAIQEATGDETIKLQIHGHLQQVQETHHRVILELQTDR